MDKQKLFVKRISLPNTFNHSPPKTAKFSSSHLIHDSSKINNHLFTKQKNNHIKRLAFLQDRMKDNLEFNLQSKLFQPKTQNLIKKREVSNPEIDKKSSQIYNNNYRSFPKRISNVRFTQHKNESLFNLQEFDNRFINQNVQEIILSKTLFFKNNKQNKMKGSFKAKTSIRAESAGKLNARNQFETMQFHIKSEILSPWEQEYQTFHQQSQN